MASEIPKRSRTWPAAMSQARGLVRRTAGIEIAESFVREAALGCESKAPLQRLQRNSVWVLRASEDFQFSKFQNSCSLTSHRALCSPPASTSLHHFCPNEVRLRASRGHHEEDTPFPEFRVGPQAVCEAGGSCCTQAGWAPGDRMAFAEHLLCAKGHPPLTSILALPPYNQLGSELCCYLV